MTSFTFGCTAALLVPACVFLSAGHRRRQRDHEVVVQNAITGMSSALEVDPPQQVLLGKIAGGLTSQESAALALQEQVWNLLPEPSPADRGSPAWERLDRLTALVTTLCWHARPVTDVRASLLGLLAQDEPHDLVSVFAATHCDISRDPLAGAQFVLTQDSAGPADDSLILPEALQRYRSDVVTDAAGIFLADAPEFSAQCTDLGAAELIRPAAMAIFAAGVSDVPGYADALCEPDPSAARPEICPADGSRESAQSDVGPPLRLADVFDVALGSKWLADARAYFPFFTFVISGLEQLRRLDDAEVRLHRAPTLFRQDAVGQDGTGDSTAHGPVPMLGAARPARTLIKALIGPRIADLVRARRMTWCMSDANAAIMRLLDRSSLR